MITNATTLSGMAASGENNFRSSVYTSGSENYYSSPSPTRGRSRQGATNSDGFDTRPGTRQGAGFETRMRERPGTSHGNATVDIYQDNVYTLAGIVPPPSPKFKPVPRVRGSAGSMIRHSSAGSNRLPSREVSMGREYTPRERRLMQDSSHQPLSPQSPYNSGENPWTKPDMKFQWH